MKSIAMLSTRLPVMAFGVACLAIPATRLSAQTSYTATVTATKPMQTLEGFGATLSWWANGVGAWTEANRNTAVDLLFAAPPGGLGLTYARYNIGGGECPSCDVIEFPHNVPGYETAPATKGDAGTYNWNNDASQRGVAQRAYADGAVFLEAQSNSAPYFMTISGTPTGGSGGKPNLAQYYGGPSGGTGAAADTFPVYLATVINHFHTSFGLTFRAVDPFNEPDGLNWTEGETKQEGCGFLAPGATDPEGYGPSAQMDAVIQNLSNQLSLFSSLAKVVAPDTNKINNAQSDYLAFALASQADLWEINTHTYSGNNEGGLEQTAATAGKRMVMSEWGSGKSGSESDYSPVSMRFAHQLISDVESLQAVDWAIWQPDYPNLWTIASYTDPDEQTVSLNEPYYIYANFAQWIRPGYQFLTNSDGNSLAAYNGRTNTLVLVTQNQAVESGTTTGESATVTYDLSGFTSVGTSMSAYQTISTTNSIGGMKLSSAPTISGTSFTATLPPFSVTTFVIPNVKYAPSATSTNDSGFTYSASECGSSWCESSQSGAYDGDNHYSSQVNSYYTLKFTGTQARVYGAFASNQGIAAYSVDGGAETQVDLYASSRSDDVLTYATPLLASGSHTLKVRVTGLKNSNASSVLVNADRVDVLD